MSTGWLIGGASRRGASHVRNGRPNQDALAFLPDSGGPAGRITGAVSDGHGAAAHFRSQIGSQLAANAAARLLAWEMDDVGANEGDPAVASEIVDHWRAAVRAHAAAMPYTDAEALIPFTDPLAPYGATLVTFAAGVATIATLQIGDGDLLFGYPGGGIERPIAADPDLVGEQTYSLCLPDAVGRFRTATTWRDAGARWPDFICATTDGVAKSFRDDAAFVAAGAQLRSNAIADWPRLLEALPDWLDDLSTHGSGDDATVCVALRADHSTGS